MNELSNLSPRPGSRKDRKRVGRGPGSGLGKTAGRGAKGQKARSSRIRPGFEGGQTPMIRRVPVRGFNHYDPNPFAILNVSDLSEFAAGSVITPEVLAEAGIIRKATLPVKLLGTGDVGVALVVKLHAFSKGAAEKIAGAGGSVEVIGG
jgi:large subunit ribosomal protein L15